MNTGIFVITTVETNGEVMFLYMCMLLCVYIFYLLSPMFWLFVGILLGKLSFLMKNLINYI